MALYKALTEFYYYGARYYDPRTSVWLGLDPMSDKYPGLSPFNFCMNNPVMLTDPNGMDVDPEASGYKDAKKAATPEYDKNGKQINEQYEPEFAKLFNNYEKDHSINVKFENTTENSAAKGEGGTVSYDGTDNKGISNSTRDIFSVNWDPSISTELGTSGMFEETAHLEDGLTGGWNIKSNSGFGIENEIKAKMWVVNNIKFNKNYTDNGLSKLTHYGYFNLGKNNVPRLTNALIHGATYFGTNSLNKRQEYSVYGYGNYKP